MSMSKTTYVLLPIYEEITHIPAHPLPHPPHTPRKEGWNILQQIANSEVARIHGSVFF